MSVRTRKWRVCCRKADSCNVVFPFFLSPRGLGFTYDWYFYSLTTFFPAFIMYGDGAFTTDIDCILIASGKEILVVASLVGKC